MFSHENPHSSTYTYQIMYTWFTKEIRNALCYEIICAYVATVLLLYTLLLMFTNRN